MGKVVLTKEEADKVAVKFTPRKFPTVITPTAVEFVQFHTQQEQPSFRIDNLVAQQAGIAELERISIEEKVEREALVRLKDLQENAYQEAYQLGLDEGREKALEEHRQAIQEKLAHLESLLQSIETLKADLVAQNEGHIMRLIFFMARRLMFDEISVNRETILNVIRETIVSSQSEENITVRVSPQDFQFIESVKEKLGKDFESLKKAKLEASEEISDGGCVISTNYGDVDARVEKRLEKLWEAVSEKLPHVKKVVGE